MNASNQVAGPSTDNFTAIFNAASNEYQRMTGKRLDTHPFAAQLDTCRSPGAVSNVLRTQAQAYNKFRKGDEKLMTWLNPTVNILFTFSATLGEGIGLPFSQSLPVSVFYSGWVVRDVVASHDKLIHLFERINFFLQRLDIHTEIPLTNDLTELLGKIMAELLSILAISTKEMTDRKMKMFLKRLVGKMVVEDGLERLDMLTKEEKRPQYHDVNGNVKDTKALTENIDDNIKATKALTEDVGDNVKLIQGVAHSVDHNVKATKHEQLERSFDSDGQSLALKAKTFTGSQLQEKLRTWLADPDPSINHNIACKTQHGGTARWFIGSTFRDGKKNGSLLWAHGNRTLLPSFFPDFAAGAGKSILWYVSSRLIL
ncbi:hypothetical protein DFH94DRAFT_700051 [Russula ochroleuca]|uniref:Fungal STAND N-terminal Goodbye domain-containing protein n=1 Tax=Russula ochroleuca TaxID=152965 RepID=A0A9P5JUH3_9AGAM|nr:hypothetical protein DFH94DRAFT_700051 [Russula ochroleuca]